MVVRYKSFTFKLNCIVKTVLITRSKEGGLHLFITGHKTHNIKIKASKQVNVI